jgi:polyisoprenoid-binding protein YceI
MNSKNLVIVIVVVLLLGALGWYSKSKNQVAFIDTDTELENNLEITESQKALSISNTESEATYEINEELQGKPVRVVGKNKEVEGSIVIDSSTKNIIKATVLLDANAFVTDIAKRDENVKALVLKSNKELNEYITFTTTKIEGLPTNLENDIEYTAKVTGDLTITGTTKEVPFDATVKYALDGSLTVSAKTQIAYEEFGIKVPDLPFLSNVSKVVDLQVTLVAR